MERKNNTLGLLFICSIVTVLAGCSLLSSNSQPVESPIVQTCIQACETALQENHDLSAGPCLLDPETDNPDWVCDVAHQPRQSSDNLLENRCASFAAGRAHHFVEVTPACQLISSR